jgi:hypothetical protein
MGDFRFHLKMNFSMGNRTDATDMSLNWSPDDEHGLTTDRHVIEWLEKNFEEGVANIRDNINDVRREHLTRREQEEREADLAQLALLREKYPED